MDIVAICVLGVCCIVGSVLGSVLWNMLLERSYFALERRVKSLENQAAGMVSVEKRNERSERFNEAAAKAMMIIQNKEIPPEEKNQKLLGVAAEYPDVALQLVKKFGGVSL